MIASHWGLLRRLHVRNPETGELYLGRLRVIETPWFGVYLHRIQTPDFGRDLHDHPWPFVSFVLRGGYREAIRDIVLRDERGVLHPARLTRHVRWCNAKRATDLHQIVSLDRTPTWTLVIRGRRWRRWGFQTPAGWVDADAYENAGGAA